MAEAVKRPIGKAELDQLRAIFDRRGRILILMQNNPDPDAMASAAALRELIHHISRRRSIIGYGGHCGRAENRAMMQTLRVDARRLAPDQLERYPIICIVDTQPKAGNNIYKLDRPAQVVIDHHLLPKRKTWSAEYADVRPAYGSTSTILYEYLQAARMKLSANLATALFYGIQSDTQDLGREASPACIRAYQDLFLLADKKKLARIRHAPVPLDYFQMLQDGLEDCVVAGKTIISCIEQCRNPDMIAEVADFLMRLEGMRCSVCYGVYGDVILLSARALDARSNMARKMKRVVHRLGTGGGHRMMAGGQIPLGEFPKKRMLLVRERLLKAFAPSARPKRLIP